MKDADKPILDENVPLPPHHRTAALEDKFNFGMLTKFDQRLFIPIGERDEDSLRANINQHKRKWEDKTKFKYTIHRIERNGKEGFGIWIKSMTDEPQIEKEPVTRIRVKKPSRTH